MAGGWSQLQRHHTPAETPYARRAYCSDRGGGDLCRGDPSRTRWPNVLYCRLARSGRAACEVKMRTLEVEKWAGKTFQAKGWMSRSCVFCICRTMCLVSVRSQSQLMAGGATRPRRRNPAGERRVLASENNNRQREDNPQRRRRGERCQPASNRGGQVRARHKSRSDKKGGGLV